MKLLARAEVQDARLVVALAPRTPLFDVTAAGVRPDMIARIALPDLTARTADAIIALFARRTADGAQAKLAYQECQPAVLADFLGLAGAEDHFDAIPVQFGAEEVFAFARDAGTILRANLKVDLSYGRPTLDAAPSALRFLRIVGGAAAAELVAELASLEPVEQMLALDHALERAIGAGGPHRGDVLDGLAEQVPDDVSSTFDSRAWREWWWRVGFASCDRDFLRAAAYAVGAAEQRWRQAGRPADEPASIHAALARMQAAPSCRWFTAAPAFHVGPTYPRDEESDGHVQAIVALGLAADRLAEVDGLPAALRGLATLVLDRLRAQS